MTSRSIVALNNFSIEAIKDFMAQMADPICALHTSTHVLLFSLFLLKVVGGLETIAAVTGWYEKRPRSLPEIQEDIKWCENNHGIYLFLICWIYLFFKSFYHNYN